jgi:hypothetical protein
VTLSDPIRTLLQVGRVLDDLGVEYLVTGSLASSFYGLSRPTQDIDLVAKLGTEHVEPLVQALSVHYYADRKMIRRAIEERNSFNLIHYESQDKVDVFLFAEDLRSREEWARRRFEHPDPDDPTRSAPFASPEDVVLRKLEWYVLGGGVSERQRQDVRGILLVQKDALDPGYLRRWGRSLGMSDLLETLLSETGFGKPPPEQSA